MTPSTPHISEEQLAALVEGGLEGSEAQTIKEHLSGCRVCMAAYADTVQLRNSWRQEAQRLDPRLAPSKGSDRFRIGLVALAACIPLLILGGAWFLLPESSPTPGNLDPLLARVATSVGEVSHDGMVHPGTAGMKWDPKPATRGGDFQSQLDADLDFLKKIPAEKLPETGRILMFSGLLAAKQFDLARIRIDRELKSGSEDPDLLLLKAISAYRDELYVSEEFLRRARIQRPGHPETRFNLGLVLLATDRPQEAYEIFTELATLVDFPLIQHRSLAELSKRWWILFHRFFSFLFD